MTKNFLKVLTKLGFVACLTLAAALVSAPRSYANVDQVATAAGQLANAGLRLGGTVASTGNQSWVSTTTTMLDLWYSGPATAAYISINASSMTFYAPYNVVDTSIGTQTSIYTAGTFDLAASTMNTLGQLCDAINGASGPTIGTNGSANGGPPNGSAYHCTLTGGIRSDVATNYLPVVTQASGVNNLAAVGGYQIPTSTAALISLGIVPASGRHVVLNYCTVESAGTPSAQVYGSLAKNGVAAAGLDYFGNPTTDATLAWMSAPLVANTATNVPLATPIAVPWLEFGQGGVAFTYKNASTGNFYNGHVVVRVNNYGLGAALQTSVDYVTCSWFEK